MKLRRFQQTIAAIVLAGLGLVIGASCTIPAEDQPQPINREQTTTSFVETP